MASAAGAGAIAGAVLGLATGLVELRVRAFVAGLLYLAVAIGATIRRSPVLQYDRETEQQLLHLGPLRWAAINGAQLGLGFTSRIGFWSWYLLPIGVIVVGDWRLGAMAWGLYGAVRMGYAVAIVYTSRSPDALLVKGQALLARRDRVTAVTRIATVIVGLALAVQVAI